MIGGTFGLWVFVAEIGVGMIALLGGAGPEVGQTLLHRLTHSRILECLVLNYFPRRLQDQRAQPACRCRTDPSNTRSMRISSDARFWLLRRADDKAGQTHDVLPRRDERH